MPNATINGIDIHYEVHGQGDPLLLIMGLGANSTAWVMQVEEFSKHYRVITFDNRDAGLSQKMTSSYTMAEMATDAVGILDEVSVETAHVFGMSMGGMIAQELVLHHPERVRALVLGGTMAGGPGTVLAGPELLTHWMSVAPLPLEQKLEASLGFLYSDEFIAQNKTRLLERSITNAPLMASADALRRQLMAVMGYNVQARLPEIDAPTLVLTGTDDKIVPAANSKILADGIPNAKLLEFDGAGHGFIIEKARETNLHVLEFLRPHDISVN